jgi:MEMO1 family protein
LFWLRSLTVAWNLTKHTGGVKFNNGAACLLSVDELGFPLRTNGLNGIWDDVPMTTGQTRKPAVAGLFYPGRGPELERQVRAYLADPPAGPDWPKALIAPHAGYPYSGEVAGRAFARIAPGRATIRRVVLFCPAHRCALRGIAMPESEIFAMPCGPVPVDQAALQQIRDLPAVETSEAAHADEHAIEVLLPFLQQVLDNFQIVPLVVGNATPGEVEQVIDQLWGGPETLIVISSDLSHYQDFATAQQMDGATSEAIQRLDPDAIGEANACGRIPIQGLLRVARKRKLRVQVLALCNSGDTAGSHDHVVGYGAYAFH